MKAFYLLGPDTDDLQCVWLQWYLVVCCSIKHGKGLTKLPYLSYIVFLFKVLLCNLKCSFHWKVMLGKYSAFLNDHPDLK